MDRIKHSGDANSAPVDIESFESLLLHVSGMRGSSEYEAALAGDSIDIKFYVFRFVDGDEQRQLEGQATCTTAEMLAKLDECGVSTWNGFHGAHPKHVLDGEQFRLDMEVNGGVKVHADGSANFPSGFSEFRQWLNGTLR